MTLATFIAFALAGQAFDVLTTKAGVESGCYEGNPLLRSIVERRRWGTLMGIKTIPIAIALAPYALGQSKGRRRNPASLLGCVGLAGLLSGVWNISQAQIGKERRASPCGTSTI